MIEIAKVVSVKNNIAKVQIMNEASCGSGCASCKGCSVVSPEHVEVECENGTNVGQVVKIERSSSAYLKSMGLVFILPLVMLFVGAGLGYGLSNVLEYPISKDLLSIVLGITFWLISYSLLGLVDKKSKLSNSVKYRIIGVL
jgi:sigma-E factor negative regulatory protein RseC